MCWMRLTNYLSQLTKLGTICDIESQMGAVQLKGLFDAGVVEPLLFGAKPEISRKEAVAAAVATFLRAYGSGDFRTNHSPAKRGTRGASGARQSA